MPLYVGSASPHSPKPIPSLNSDSAEGLGARGEQDGSSDDGSIARMHGNSKRKRLSILKSKTKAKTKKLLRIDGAHVTDGSDSEADGVFANIEHDPAFHSSSLDKDPSFQPGKTANKTLNHMKSLGKAVAHPVDSVKSKATRTTAGQLSKVDRPDVSKKADEEYLHAHDNLQKAESTSPSRHGIGDDEQQSTVGEHKDEISEMEAHRESLRVAFTTSRHVRRVRVVPKLYLEFPNNEYFIEKDEKGDPIRYDWLLWLGYNLLYYTQSFSSQYIDDFDELPFDIDSSRHYIERLLLSSAPWQSWAMDVRAVYRWEDTRTTAKWLAIYLVLWYTQHLMGFFYGYIIYTVVRNHYFPTSAESIRESMKKAADDMTSATQFSELIDKHGGSDWLEPVMEQLGPAIQLQLGDMANMLEVFSNFYHWKYPKKTIASLYFFGACLALTIFTDMEYCMKVFWFIVGGGFFLCWPIASRYPKYRYLVSPFKWVFWDIPTNAEWSFQYLRRQGQISREQMIKMKVDEGHRRELAHPAADHYTGRISMVPAINVDGDGSAMQDSNDDDDDGYHSASSTSSILEATDLRSFRAQSHGSIGRLIVFSKGIRYVRSLPKKELWRLGFQDLAEMRKLEGSKRSKLTSLSPDQLEIKCVDGREMHLGGMKERDEAFNTIIAFSSLQWQSLQVLSDSAIPGIIDRSTSLILRR